MTDFEKARALLHEFKGNSYLFGTDVLPKTGQVVAAIGKKAALIRWLSQESISPLKSEAQSPTVRAKICFALLRALEKAGRMWWSASAAAAQSMLQRPPRSFVPSTVRLMRISGRSCRRSPAEPE